MTPMIEQSILLGRLVHQLQEERDQAVLYRSSIGSSTNTLLMRSYEQTDEVNRLHGRVVKGVGHLGHDEVMEAGGREFDPRPGHYSRMSF